uniref:uncharacterized protein LOC125906850 n=1 Tax=Anopheles coluzzii TaxID=1518534 RepID=UPI0020FF845C|nr:uncharacterized protein LOC125906850 [Anopheles coluzzii]
MCRDVGGNRLTGEREVIERWKCYFEGHLNGAEVGEAGVSGRTRQPPQQQHSSNTSDNIGADDEVPPPSLDEIASPIKQHKSNKSAASDGLVAELFKMAPERLTVEMNRLIVKIWEQEELPEKWKLGVIHPVYKKGDRLDCSNFRAITVLNATYSLFCRLTPLATTDQFFTLRQKVTSRRAESASSLCTTCSSALRRPTTP